MTIFLHNKDCLSPLGTGKWI